MEHIRRFFAPPTFEDQITSRRAGGINRILLIVILGSASVLLASLIQQDQGGIQVASVIVPLGVGLWLIFKQGNLVIPGLVFPCAIILGLTYQIWRWGVGTSDEVMLAFPVVIALGSFMLGGRSPLFFTLAVNLVITATGLAEINGALDHQYASRTDYFDLFLFNAFIVVNGAIIHVFLSSYTKNLEQVIENERNLRETNEELQTARLDLEARFAERTRDLTLSAEIGRAVAQERNLDVLLPNAVERIHEVFALYYTQIYLTDPAARNLILRAGSGTVGQELLQRGHRLPIASSSINGSAAFTKKSVMVEDTAKSESFLPNPLLPKTRSEMAIPLLSGERVLGVLNMQSELPNTFTEETLPAYEILAGQLAAAIENANRFTEIEKARAKVEAQSSLLTRKGWDAFLDGVRQPEYVGMAYQDGEVASLAAPVHSEIGDEWAIPISVAGAEIGSIQLETENRTLSPEDQEVAIRLAALAGQHIENLRLLTEAEHYRREAEQAARRLTREGWGAYLQSTDEFLNGYIFNNNQVRPLTQAEEANREPGYVHPLTIRGEPIGAIELAMQEGSDTHDAEIAELVASVAEALTKHIENLRLAQATDAALGETETQARRLAAMNRMAEELGKANELKEIYNIAAKASLHIIGADQVSVTLADGEGNLELFALDGQNGAIPLGIRLSVHGTVIGKVFQEQRAMKLSDIRNAEEYMENTQWATQGVRSTLLAPLLTGGKVLGTLNLGSLTLDAYDEEDVATLQQIATLLATTIENNRLLEGAQKRAEREAMVNLIGQKIQSATTVQGALQTAIQELGLALKARKTAVELAAKKVGKQESPSAGG